MDVMRGLGERGDPTPLAGVENLMLHFTPYSEDWSKLPVIVSGEGSYVTDDRGRSYIDGLAGLFTTQVGHGRTELAEVAAKQMKELGFFPNWSFQHPRSLELAHKIAEIAPGDLNSTFFVSSGSEAVETAMKLARQYHEANWGVEIKAEWPDGAPISGRDYQERFKGLLARKLLEGGLICRFEDKEDPVIQFSPALVADKEVLSKIVEVTDSALADLERRIGAAS